jgi:lipoprotein-anchoring transpeptidase ErfK/SrfK
VGSDSVPTTTPTKTTKVTPTISPDCHCEPDKHTVVACQPPGQGGQVILVCKTEQKLYAYQDGKLVYSSLVETGRPNLPTPTGVFHIFYKNCSDKEWLSNSYNQGVHNGNCGEHNGDGYVEQFTSPFPPGSPDYYYPTNINYAMEFADGGFFLHDAWWHCDFGPGSNVPHYTGGCPGWAGGHEETGSHGCVGMPVSAAAWLYAWSHIGTTVIVTQ